MGAAGTGSGPRPQNQRTSWLGQPKQKRRCRSFRWFEAPLAGRGELLRAATKKALRADARKGFIRSD